MASYCQACQGVENEWIAREVNQFCPAGAAPAPTSFAQQARPTSHAGMRLLRMLRSRAATLELHQAVVTTADVCSEEPGDCVLQVDPHFKAIFKDIDQEESCCLSIKPVIVSAEDPNSTVVSSFCSGCRAARSNNIDVDHLFQVLCPMQASG